MTRKMIVIAGLWIWAAVATSPAYGQSSLDARAFFQQNIGLSADQINAIQNGEAVSKALPSRIPDEVMLFGAVYIHAEPEKYVQFAHDFDRLRKLPNYLALGVFSDPPKRSDLLGFSFDSDDIQAIRKCKPGDCLIQMPATSMDVIRHSFDWSQEDAAPLLNQFLQGAVLQRLLDYQRSGNQVLGTYDDKRQPTDVAKQFAYMLSYYKVLPQQLPDFYHYLLAYPDGKAPNIDSLFYWSKVKFGLKPTLRLVQVITRKGEQNDPVKYAIAEKQLYASHYFETALDLSFCVRGSDDPSTKGFYLMMVLGSEQAGLTGPKGAIIRKVAVGRSVSNLRDALSTIKLTLEME